MRFGRWHPLERAAEHAPAGPAVYQIRVAVGLIDYPRGKSAMIHYGAGSDVGPDIAELAGALGSRPLLCRFSEDMTARELADPGGILRQLLDTFERRFGCPPRLLEP